MENNKNIANATSGINLDAHPSVLKEQEYSFGLNVLHESHDGGIPLLTNEPSNILCSRFKEGYKVIGRSLNILDDKVYFFITNPETGASEIGYIEAIHHIQELEDSDADRNCNCDYKKILAAPLEDQEQLETCSYTTLINDECNLCLNFSVLHPIQSIVFKENNIYFTDNFNPPRVIKLDNIEEYKYFVGPVCDEDPVLNCEEDEECDCEECEDTCPNCDKMKIFMDFSYPCYHPEVLINGGNLKQGTYQFTIAYSDPEGNELSEYYAITPPVPIFDQHNNIIDQTLLNKETTFGIRVKVEQLDSKYEYYKVAVVQNTAENGALRAFVGGVFPVSTTSFVYTTENNKSTITFEELYALKTKWEKTKGMTSSEGVLYQYGLTAREELNLQPMVILLSAFLKWQMGVARETLYKDGIADANFAGYLRNENYAVGIQFGTDDGYISSPFPFTHRPPTSTELEEVDEETNDDIASVLQFTPQCAEPRDKRWQFYNTATLDAEAPCSEFDEYEGVEVEHESTARCEVEVLNDETDGSITIVIPDGYTNLKDFINANKDEFCTGGAYEDAYLCDILTDEYVETCTPEVGDHCELGDVAEEEIFISEVVAETIVDNPKDLEDYTPKDPPGICNVYKVDTVGDKILDTAFGDTYLGGSSGTGAPAAVYERNVISGMASCVSPGIVSSSSLQGFYMDYLGDAAQANLQTALNTGCVAGGFTNKVHKNSLWFQVDFNGADSILIEISRRTDCVVDEDLAANSEIRLNTFTDCSATTSTECLVVDLDDGAIMELEKADYGGNETIYIVIDAPIETTVAPNYYINPPCGCFSISTREYEILDSTISWTGIKVSKEVVYDITCTFTVPNPDDCEVKPYLEGKFGYYESTRTYPDNKELYDASTFKVDSTLIPASIKEDFETYFTDAGGVDADDFYILNDNAKLYCQPIRHYKMPNNDLAPFMFNNPLPGFQQSIIFPLGLKLDNDVINFFLDMAVVSGLITQELRSRITRYHILRGDRTLDKSIVTKGMLFDMYRYQDNNGQTIHYPNYPYNTLGGDAYHFEDSDRDTFVPHPFSSTENNRFTFHGPETHFMQPPPALPTELEYEGYQFGRSRGNFEEVQGHPKYVILGRSAYNTALALAIVEAALETAIIVGRAYLDYIDAFYVETGATNGGNPAGVATGAPWIAAIFAAQTLASTLFQVGRYRYEWLNLFRNNGSPLNFAYKYGSFGWYNYLLYNHTAGNLLRGLSSAHYLKGGGRYAINEKDGSDIVRINNIERESSVYLSLGNDTDGFPLAYDTDYLNYDNYSNDIFSASRRVASDSGNCEPGVEFDSNIASPYVSLKNFITEQYGDINNIKWLNTNYCGKLLEDNSCEFIWGGDTKISRMSLKRKLPHFLVNALGQANHTPFAYTLYNNIGNVKFYGNFNIELANTVGATLAQAVFPDVGSEYNFNCFDDKFYIAPPSKFFLFSYGIPQFLVESEINLNYRYARKEPWEWFYPNGGASDYNSWTQERNPDGTENVPIRYDNEYNYNFGYSRNQAYEKRPTLPPTYNAIDWRKKSDFRNGVIGSQPDTTITNTIDPWLTYKPFDVYEFKSNSGVLVELKDIESGQMIARFKNQFAILNTIDELRERLNPYNQKLGVGIFGQRAIEFKKTALGYAGTQHAESLSTEFGVFWVDAKRGQVINVDSNGQNPRDIAAIKRNGAPSGVRNWFREHLPFKILKGGISGITEDDVDNNYNGPGIALGWDSRYRRVLITKKDYKVVDSYRNLIIYDGGQYFITPTSSRTITLTGTSGTANITINGVDYLAAFNTNLTTTASDFVTAHEANILAHSGLVITANGAILTLTGATATFSAISITNATGDLSGTIGDLTGIREEIFLTDTTYFTDVSWTWAYAPMEDSWISLYSYKPNYYIGHQNYFQGGWNNAVDETENGLWSHLLTNRSFTVFCGKYYPVQWEVPSVNKFVNRIFQTVEYWMDVRHYTNAYDFAEQRDLGATKAWVYNNSHNSGELNLVTELKNNLQQKSQYPQVNSNSTSILQTLNDKKFTFNMFFNRVRNELNGQPQWLHDDNGFKTTLNPLAFNYIQRGVAERLRGDWASIRMEWFADSRYKIIFKWLFSKENVQP